MFGLGSGELIIIILLAILLFGPKQLPEIAKTLAKFTKEVMKARNQWLDAVNKDDSLNEIRKSVSDIQDSVNKPIAELQTKIRNVVDQAERDIVDDEKTELIEHPKKPESK